MWEWDPQKDKNVQRAVQSYLADNDLVLPHEAIYEAVIDGVFICVDDNVVLRIGLPPVSNYPVHETEHTDKYLRKREPIAV